MYNTMAARNWKNGVWKRRSNILYKLRKKGVKVDTRTRIIFIPLGEDPYKAVQVRRLRKEFYFEIQYVIV